MANTPGTLSSTMVTMRVIDYLKEMFPPILRLYMGFSGQRAKYKGKLITRIPGASAAYDAENGYAPQDVTDVDVEVVADKFKATSIRFTPGEMSQTDRDLVDEHAAAAANVLGAQLMDDFFSIILAAAFTHKTTELAANVDDDVIRAIRKKFTGPGRNVPMMGALGILNGDAWEALTGDAPSMTMDTNPAAQDLFALGLNRIRQRGFEIFEYSNLPANGEDLAGVFVSPGGIVGATGIPKDANEAGFWDDVPANASVRPQTDPDTGITLLERRTRSADGSAKLDLAWIYGFDVGDPKRVERLAES